MLANTKAPSEIAEVSLLTGGSFMVYTCTSMMMIKHAALCMMIVQ